MNENGVKLRKQFVFLLNLALDTAQKDTIAEEEMLQFSNEVAAFKRWVSTLDVDASLKQSFKNVEFYYSSLTKGVISILPLFFSKLILYLTDFIFNIYRKRKLNLFLEKQDKKLHLLDDYKTK